MKLLVDIRKLRLHENTSIHHVAVICQSKPEPISHSSEQPLASGNNLFSRLLFIAL